MINRKEEIKQKGFAMQMATEDTNSKNHITNNFSKIRVGAQTLDDATLTFGSLKRIDKRLADKDNILRAMYSNDYATMKEVSNFFYRTSGIYSRLCRYLAYLYRYDWFVTPYINEKAETKNLDNKILSNFNQVLFYLDNFRIKEFCGDVALKVIKNGCYYGYLVPKDNTIAVQELPEEYCRSRFFVNGHPAIEFKMSFFDEMYRDTEKRNKVLKLFPEEFRKGYIAFKNGKTDKGWYLLDPKYAFKFNINGEDFPFLISVIPAIIDLDEAKDLDRKKMAQKLLKILIQKMPVDKNGDLVFDIDEAQDLHNNAVRMLSKAIGIDVLTTFADVEVADMSDRSNMTARDDLEKVERSVYNEAGVSQMQFNTDGNLALEKSILNDEASLYDLIGQFERFLNDIITIKFNTKPKKYYYRLQMLTTTIYNYKEMAKLYKEQT